MLPWTNPSPQPKWHLDQFSCFCRTDYYDRPTDQATRSVTTGRIYVRSTAMWPNNNACDTIVYLLGDKHSSQAGGFLRPECATSSECPRASIAARRRVAGSITTSRRASCCCSNATAGIAIGANFKMYQLHCSNRVEIFLQYTGDTHKK